MPKLETDSVVYIEAEPFIKPCMLTIGGSDVNAFAGLNGGESDALGLELGGVDFGLALMTSTTDATRSWTSSLASKTKS